MLEYIPYSPDRSALNLDTLLGASDSAVDAGEGLRSATLSLTVSATGVFLADGRTYGTGMTVGDFRSETCSCETGVWAAPAAFGRGKEGESTMNEGIVADGGGANDGESIIAFGGMKEGESITMG